MQVRITDSGNPRNRECKIVALPEIPGEPEIDLSGKCSGYEIRGRPNEVTTATLLVYSETNVTADADLVEVPRTLVDRARDMAARLGNPAVTAAFGELLGVSMRAERPEA